MANSPPLKIIVIGAGPVGLNCALASAQAGYQVQVIDNGINGAGWASGGMLSPFYEMILSEATDAALTDFAFESVELWLKLARKLRLSIQKSSLIIANDPVQVQAIESAAELAIARGLKVAKTKLPMGMRGLAAWNATCDLTLNPREALYRLTQACADLGVHFLDGQAEEVTPAHVILASGERIKGDRIIVATGQSENRLAASLPELKSISHVKGHLFAFDASGTGFVSTTIRCGRIYIIPRHDTYVVGATSTPSPTFDLSVNPDEIEQLRKEACAIVPFLAFLPIDEAWTGLRPVSGDGLPMIGQSSMDNVYLACGTGRNGWLLAPAIAKALQGLIVGDQSAHRKTQPFSPQRFPN